MTRNFINTTPHVLNFRDADGNEFEVKPCGFLLNATVVENFEGLRNGVIICKTFFVGDSEGEAWLAKQSPDAIIIGSIIAAQAYPGKVLALTPAPGFERVPVEKKRMNPNKFTTF